MKRKIHIIVFIIAVFSLLEYSCGNESVPVDALNIVFTSETSLVYDNQSFIKWGLHAIPVYDWYLDSGVGDSNIIGKAKITGAVWNTGLSTRLNQYEDVKAYISDSGNILALYVAESYWLPEESYQNIFDAEFSGLYTEDGNLIKMGPFKLSDISETNKCIPVNSSNINWKQADSVWAYNNDSEKMRYKFTIYNDGELLYFGCNDSDEEYFIICITDTEILDFLH